MRLVTKMWLSAVGLAGSVAIVGFHAVAQDDANDTCPWVVQANEPILGLGSDAATYEIRFTGVEPSSILYGFTVTDPQLASRLVRESRLPDRPAGMVPLHGIEEGDQLVYKLPPESILPKTIYLGVSPWRVDRLEQIDARIEPPRSAPVNRVTRGASDHTGPLPQRSIRGTEIISMPENVNRLMLPAAGQGIQLCAYQVSWS